MTNEYNPLDKAEKLMKENLEDKGINPLLKGIKEGMDKIKKSIYNPKQE